ncbi:MAG: HupE/UreJ family protein [Firmicutes bacterium]|nr:HupE/UreJ family protein [Bacillota bacterium]
MRRALWARVGISATPVATLAWRHVGVGPIAGCLSGLLDPPSGAQTGILVFVPVLGLVLLVPLRLTTWLGPALVAVSAFFYRRADGADIPGGAAGWAALVGFAGTTALLHLLGIFLGEGLLRGGEHLRRRHRLARPTGLGAPVLGVGGVLA